MANRWTGDYDAVLQVAPAGIDPLLAALHRKGSPEVEVAESGPHLLHSGSFNLPLGQEDTASRLRGHLQFQVSTPSVSLPSGGDDGQVRISMEVMAWFQPTLISAAAPSFIHGTLSLSTPLSVVQCQGALVIDVRVQTNLTEASFVPAPGSGLDADEIQLVEQVIREVLATHFEPVHLRVTPPSAGSFSVRDLALRTLRTGGQAAFSLMLELLEGGASPNPAAVDEIFLQANDDAAIALGGDFIERVLFDLAQEPLSEVRATGSRFFVDFDGRLNPGSLRIELQPGSLLVGVEGVLSLSPGGSYNFRLSQEFGIAVQAGQLSLTLQGSPTLNLTSGNRFLRRILGLFTGRITSAIQSAAAGVVVGANSELNRVIAGSVGGLLERLAVPGIELGLTRASIDRDAILIGGEFDIGNGPPVEVSFTSSIQRPPGVSPLVSRVRFSALESWIPGGTIERFVWRESRADGGTGRRVVESHSFVTALEPELSMMTANLGWPPSTWCLDVEGRQVSGRSTRTVSGSLCGTTTLVPSLPFAGSGRMTVSVPDGQGGSRADIDPWGPYRSQAFAQDEEVRGYLLVHLVREELEQAVLALTQGLEGSRERGPVVMTTVVIERGTKTPKGAEFAFTHDGEGAWRKRLDLKEPGSSVLLGPGGRELWRDRGPLNPKELAKVLAGLREDRPRVPRRNLVQLGALTGVLAPDLMFPCATLGAIAMRKMRGREVRLCFWTSWSEASVEELRRQAAGADESRDGPLVLCINDGEPAEHAETFFKRLGLGIQLVIDDDRRISRRYGVSCWPTVVTVNRRGRIAKARMGLEVSREDAAGKPTDREGCPVALNARPLPRS